MADLARNFEINHPSGNYSIRQAKVEDIDGLIELYGLSDDYHYQGDSSYFCKPPQPPRTVKYIKDTINHPLKVIFVLEKGKELLGFQETNIHDFAEVSHTYPRRTAFVVTVFLKEEIRGMGVGEKIFDVGIDWAKTMGVHEVTGDVFSFNQDSLNYFLHNLKFKVRYHHVYLNISNPKNSSWKPQKPSRVRKILRKMEGLIKKII